MSPPLVATRDASDRRPRSRGARAISRSLWPSIGRRPSSTASAVSKKRDAGIERRVQTAHRSLVVARRARSTGACSRGRDVDRQQRRNRSRSQAHREEKKGHDSAGNRQPTPPTLPGQLPPQVETGRDPHDHRQRYEVDDDAPGSRKDAFLLEAAPGMHTRQEMVPAKAPIFHRDLLPMDAPGDS